MAVPCCVEMEETIRLGLLAETNGEVCFPPRPLREINPEATAGNVITGESYDPAEFSLTWVLRFCPFCADYLGPVPDDDEGWEELPVRPVEDTRPL